MMGTTLPGTVGRLNTGRLVYVRRVTEFALHLVSLPEGHTGEDNEFMGGHIIVKSPFCEVKVVDISLLSERNKKFVAGCACSGSPAHSYRLRRGNRFGGLAPGETVRLTEAQAEAFPELMDVEAYEAPPPIFKLIAVPQENNILNVDRAFIHAVVEEFDGLTLKELTKNLAEFEKPMDQVIVEWHVEQMLKAGQLRWKSSADEKKID